MIEIIEEIRNRFDIPKNNDKTPRRFVINGRALTSEIILKKVSRAQMVLGNNVFAVQPEYYDQSFYTIEDGQIFFNHYEDTMPADDIEYKIDVIEVRLLNQSNASEGTVIKSDFGKLSYVIRRIEKQDTKTDTNQ